MRHGFLIWPGNKVPDQSVEVSDVVKAEESKTVKVMIMFFDVGSIVPCAFLSLGQTIKQQVYKEIKIVAGQTIAISLRQYICPQHTEHLAVPGWKEHHNLSIYLTLLFVIFLFPKLKEIIKGTIKRAVMTELGGIPEFFQLWIEVWQRRMESTLELRGIVLKGKLCSLFFGIEMNCLWHPSRHFLETPCKSDDKYLNQIR